MDTVGNQLVTATRRQVDALSNKHLLSILPKGGSTRVELKTPQGEEFMGLAYCSNKDPFNRGLGLKIALNRALGQERWRKDHPIIVN